METSGAVPPVHLERDPFGSAASSGDGMPLPKRRGIGGTGAKRRTRGEAAAAATASAGEMSLTNLSNLMMDSSRPPRDALRIELPSTTTPRARVAGEKHTKFRSNSTPSPRGSSLPRVRSNTSSSRVSSLSRVTSSTSSPRDSSLPRVRSNVSSPRGSFLPRVRSNASSPRGLLQPMDRSNTYSSRKRNSSQCMDKSNPSSPRDSSTPISQRPISTSTAYSRFALLSINNADPFSTHVDAHLGNTAACSGRESVINHHPTQKAGMQFSGGDMPQWSHSILKAGVGLRIEVPHKHQIVTDLKGETAQNHRAVRGLDEVMPQGTSAALKAGVDLSVEIPQKLMIITERPHRHQALTGSKGEVSLTGLNGVVPPKRRTKDQGSVIVKELRTARQNSKSAGSSVEIPQKLMIITERPHRHQALTGLKGEVALTGLNGVVPPKRRTKDQGSDIVTELRTARQNSKSAGSSVEIPQKLMIITERPHRHQALTGSKGEVAFTGLNGVVPPKRRTRIKGLLL